MKNKFIFNFTKETIASKETIYSDAIVKITYLYGVSKKAPISVKVIINKPFKILNVNNTLFIVSYIMGDEKVKLEYNDKYIRIFRSKTYSYIIKVLGEQHE